MSCRQVQNEIEDFLYGELAEQRAMELRAHLADCSACAAVRDRVERENEVFAQFYEETQLEPTGEMWEAIRARLDVPPRRARDRDGWGGASSWLPKLAVLRQAAVALLLIALSVAATLYFTRRGGDNAEKVAREGRQSSVTPTPQSVPTPSDEIAIGETGSARPPAKDRSGGTVLQSIKKEHKQPAPRLSEQELIAQQIARAEREYRSAIHLLDGAIAKHRNGIRPEVMREYEASLALIDDSIARSRRALRERPGDLSAGQFLLAAYAKKVELMQDLAMR